MIKHAGIFILLFLWHDSALGQLRFSNPSFEGPSKADGVPSGWIMCEGTPDTQPGLWNTTISPNDGNSYVGLHNYEAISAEVSLKQVGGLCNNYRFEIDIAIAPLDLPDMALWVQNNQGKNPGRLCLYGGNSPCEQQDMIWISPVISSLNQWETYTIDFTLAKDYKYITFRPEDAQNGKWTYFALDKIKVISNPAEPSIQYNPSICEGSAISVSVNDIDNAEYFWTGPNNFSSQERNIYIPGARKEHEGEYQLRVEIENCGVKEVYLDINVLAKPNPPMLPIQRKFCENGKIEVEQLDGSTEEILWIYPDGAKRMSSILKLTGTAKTDLYKAVSIYPNGCSSDTSSVYLHIEPSPKIDLGPDIGLCDNDSIIFAEEIPGAYLWSNNTTNMSMLVKKPGTYWLEVSSSNGCKSCDTVKVFYECPPILYIPNSFTPNQDGVNDIFMPVGEFITELNIKILNRWGECIFESSNLEAGWDGYFKNTPVPEGEYLYMISYSGTYQFKTFTSYEYGVVSLIR